MGAVQLKEFLSGRVVLHLGDCLPILAKMEANSVDAVVCDPPYHLSSIVKRFGADGAAPAKGNAAYARASAGFMGKKWDGGDIAFRAETWRLVLRVLKPGGYLLAFSGTRTYHRMAVAIEDAGFEIRDMIGWVYGSGFPKSLDISKAIDKAAGAERTVTGVRPGHEDFIDRTDPSSAGARREGWDRPWKADPEKVRAHHLATAPATPEAAQWEGYGTALKPAQEPICMARKPIEGTNAENVLKWGVGGLNIDGCRIEGKKPDTTHGAGGQHGRFSPIEAQGRILDDGLGRWPANLIHDGSDEVLAAFPDRDAGGDVPKRSGKSEAIYGEFAGGGSYESRADTGSAARFFYTSKADAEDRLGSKHPTVKPLDLMQYLVRLVTPKNGLVLDPFAGTGTTGEAAWREGMRAVLIEAEAEYHADIERRMDLADNPTKRTAVAKTKNNLQGAVGTPLFGDSD